MRQRFRVIRHWDACGPALDGGSSMSKLVQVRWACPCPFPCAPCAMCPPSMSMSMYVRCCIGRRRNRSFLGSQRSQSHEPSYFQMLGWQGSLGGAGEPFDSRLTLGAPLHTRHSPHRVPGPAPVPVPAPVPEPVPVRERPRVCSTATERLQHEGTPRNGNAHWSRRMHGRMGPEWVHQWSHLRGRAQCEV